MPRLPSCLNTWSVPEAAWQQLSSPAQQLEILSGTAKTSKKNKSSKVLYIRTSQFCYKAIERDIEKEVKQGFTD